MQEEFGIITKKVRLAPSPILLEQIKEEVREEHDKDELRRKEKKLLSNKKKHKRKHGKNDTQNNRTNKGSDKKRSKGAINNNNSSSKKTKATRLSSSSSSSVGQEIQSRVDSAIQQNSILSSIFTKERMRDIHKIVYEVPYDIHPMDWILAFFNEDNCKKN